MGYRSQVTIFDEDHPLAALQLKRPTRGGLLYLNQASLLGCCLAEDSQQEDEIKERVKRENGDVTVLSLEEIARLRDPPLGVLSSTARTFVTGGATTEYATQILGTTVGRTYARLLSTGSRVYYDNIKPSKEPTPYLVFPSIPQIPNPTSAREQHSVEATTSPKADFVDTITSQPLINEIIENPDPTTSPQPVVSVRKEFSVKRNSEVKPAKVKPNSDLPTVTIKAEFAPSGYSETLEERRDKKLRAAKGLFRGGVQIKNEFQKYDTVTYVGFADFTTTVGNTIIVFMPKTAMANNGPVTSIAGAATLRPEDAGAPVVSTVKTFLSHSPGMATKTVTGHNLDMQTSLPTVQADTRASKAYNPIYLTTEDMEDATEKGTTPLKLGFTDDIRTTDRATTDADVKTEPGETETARKGETTTETLTTEMEDPTTPEGSEMQIPHEEIKATESLKVSPTFATTSTKVFIHGKKPLGLAKSIAVIEAVDETTTYFTSFLFGTIIDGQYTQLTQVVSSTSSPPSIAPTPVVTDHKPTSKTLEVSENPVAEDAETTTENGDSEMEEPVSRTAKLVTKLVPSTVQQTYTYLTTFFVPQGDTTTTSVKTREVISDEVRYVATVIPENQSIETTVSPTGTTQKYQTATTPEVSDVPSTEDTTELNSTPQLPETTLSAVTQEISTKAEEMTPTISEETTIESEIGKSKQSEKEEEVEIIIRTLYTTYTYLTTFFQESTTSVQSREVVETNVVTSTLDTAAIPEATDPAVAGLFNPSKSEAVEASSSAVVERPPSDDSHFKTYTYYTTVFVDGETIVESRTEVVKETISPSATASQIFKTVSVDDNSIIPKGGLSNEDSPNQKKKPSYGTISRPKINEMPSSEALIMPHPLQSSIDDAYSYDTTMSPLDRIGSTKSPNDPDEKELALARDEELKKEAMLAIGMTSEDSEIVETMVTDITSSSSGGNRRKSYDEYESPDPNDQISSESNTEEIEPSFSPTILLQTSYTTFTYFTTVYKGTSSDIISRLETVTNVVTETVKPTEVEPKLSPEEATLPITYFTTFTYWTTLYKGKNTQITSREETISNVVTPTLEVESGGSIEMTVSPIVPTSTADYIEPTVMIEPSILPAPPVPTEVIASPAEKSADEPVEPLPTEALLEPTTYYTTYTYFTTSYIGNETVINSHLETETNVETATRSSLSEVTEQITASQVSTEQASLTPTGTTTPPTGLISTIRTSDVNDGVTTLLNTDIYGTYIDGLYAQVLESSSEIVAPSAASSTTDAVQPTGVVSINEGKIVDANGVTTTHFTTKAIGTYIDALYAQVLESTSSVVVDEVKKTELPPESESTVTLGTKIFTTGLVRLIEGSIVKDLTTTFYESRVIGTVIDGRYAQIIESTSSFKSGMSSTADILSPTSTLPPASGISPTQAVTTSSPATLEGSQPGDGEDGDDDEDGENQKSKPGFQGKKKTFTPVIRPFSSRPRPTFQPKKKTGDPATTITRTSFTPTVTATPASKSGFGSSRNRFAANRSKVSTNALSEIKPTASSSRRFSRPRSTSAASFGGASSFGGGSRSRSSPSRVQPTASATPSARRGGFNYRSTGRPNAILPTASRSRIRPTGVNPFNRFSSTTPVEEINNNDISGAAVTEDVEHNTASEEEQEEIVTSAPTTTTESPRRANNPLLRFRRPPILQRTVTTTSTTPKPQTTPKRSPSLLRRPDSRSGGAVATTPRSRPTVSLNRIKPRPASSLFPPRGKKPNQDEVEESEKEEQEPNEEIADDEIQDNEYDGSETAEQTSSTTTEVSKNSRRSKALSPVVQIRPFTRRPRTKRQADYGNRYSARYRRPVARASSYDYDYDYSPEPVREVVTRPPTSRGYSSRNSRNQQIQSRDYSRDVQTQQTQPQQQLQPRVRPSSVPSTPRHQFTLRERTPQQTTTSPRSSNFRRPTTSPRRRLSTELTTPSQRLSKPVTRHRPVTTESPSYSRGTIRRFNNQQQSRRTTARSRYRDSNDFDTYSAKPFDGTITVTHRVPTEVTIPVVNGKNTEYKPVITAKPSLEVLAPFQYSSTIGKDGKSTIVLNSDLTSTLPNGFMEVTKFVIFETPTTSVTFTPTTLRGRKTSFSHIVPSTVYEVRPEVSTIQPNLGDNPLANILLSQLLLGNLAQPTIAGQPQTPVTEYKTKTTTYVTTVTSHTSTILPLTFRGKEITTTIVDSSVHVITATEYLTETVVVTPTAVIQPGIANPLNTLLLPALLQAQILNQQTPNPLLKVQPQKQFDELYNLDKQIEDEDAEQRLNKKDEYNEEERKVRESNEEQEQEIDAKPARKKSKLKLKDKDKILDSGSTVVTLYVSGKHPGEFTTVLSTVPINEKSSASVKKREIDSALWNAELFKIQASRTPELGSSFSDEISNYISPVLDEVRIESSEVETPSLESELTYGNRYLKLYQSTHPELLDDDEVSEQNQQSTGHFLLAGHAESAPDQRKASSRSSPFLHREKRDTSPVRKVIRIRVPVSRRKFNTEEGHDYYEGAASSQLEETHGSVQEHTGNEEHERKVKKVLVARRKPIETSEPVRRRILVTKRRPIFESGHSDVVEPHQEEQLEFPSEVEEHLDSIAPTSATRRRVLRTKKRLIHQSVEEAEQIEPSEQAPKRRITVTRKRVVQTGDPGSARDQNMRTLYNYQYSIPSDGPGSSVMVSEVFMSGSGITSQMESDIDFKELMEDAAGGITQANQKPTEGTENYGKEESSTSSSSQESTENQEEPTDGKANEGSTKAVTANPVESDLELKQAIKNDESYLQGDTRESDENEYIHTSGEESTQKPVSGTPSSTPEEPEYYDYSDDVEQPGDEDIASHQGADLSNENFESKDENTDLESSFVTIFPYDMPDSTSSSTASLPDATNTIKTPESSKVELRPLEIGQFGPTEIPVSISDVTEIPVTISMEPMEDPVTITAGFYGVVETDATSTTSQAAPEATSQASTHTTSRVTSQTSSQESSQTTTHITSQTIKPSITPTQSQTPEARTTITDTPNSTDTTEPNDIPKQNDIPIEPATLIEYQTIVKTLTTTRSRTFTYVVTRVSGDEHYVTSSTTVKPDIKTTTVTEILPVLPTQSGTSPIGGRGLYVIEPRHNLATKVMANGVEVIVAGDKSTLPGSPLLKVIPTGLAKPITLAPSTLTDHMMMVLPPESQKPHKEFVTKTYTTSYHYLATLDKGGSSIVTNQDKIVHNKVTEEVNPSKTIATEHVSLTASPTLTTGIYHTTYTYLNTLVDGEQPLVVSSKRTVANTVVEQPSSIQPSPKPLKTNTYKSTVPYTKTVTDGDITNLVKTQDVLTQVVITESDYLPSSVSEKPTLLTTDVVKTYFATYTYFNSKVVDGDTVIKTEIATSSDVVTETFIIQPKKTTSHYDDKGPTKLPEELTPTNSINLYATKTYLTTFTYFTTLLQDNKSPSIIVKSRTKVQQNIVTESVDDGLIDPNYLSILRSSVSQNKEPIVATATLNNGVKMEVTAAASKLISPESVDLGSSFGDASNVVTGSTIIFFDDEVQPTPALGSSIFETSSEHTSIVTKTPALLTSTPALQASQSSVSNTKITSPDDADESMLIEMAADPPTTSGGSSPVNNIFQGFNALGPVINAMADLFQNNFGENKKKNESRPSFNIPQAYLYQKPKDTASKPPTTQVSPVYVPLREPSDSETAESQHLGGMNVFLDIHQRNKPGADRNNIEAALLSGGIAISPGQVITTNSDVIIGKHAVHGPRPPLKPSAKNDIVEGMKPPPPPGPHSQSNHSPSKSTPAPIASSPLKTGGVLAKPNWPVRDQERYPSVLVPHRVALPPPKQEAPPLVPPPLRPQFTHSNNKHISKPGAPDRSSTEQKFSMQIDPPKEPHGKPHKYYKNPTYQRVPYEPSQKESGPSHYEPRPPYRNGPYKNEKNRPAQTKPAVTINREDNNEKTTLVNVSIVHEMNSNQREPFVTTPAVDQTLLVNIQPSQVANVVIPHGISTALIYSGGSSEVPSQKGEIFNEPSPYPDAEVGLVGVAGLSTSGESTHVPSNAVRLDVPVSPQAVDIQSLKRPTHTDLGWHRNQSKRPPTSLLDDASGLEFMTPPPPPHPQISSYVNYHLPKDQMTDDQEGEYSVNNEYHAESGENSNPNVKNWPQWDSKINSGLVLPNRPRPFRPFSNYTNDLGPPGVQYSVINSKPVLLGHENTEKQPPIVKGKPSVTSFDNKDEATVSVGLPTNLAPADEVASIPTASNKQDNPIVLRPTFESKREKPLQAKPIYKPKPMPSNKYVDNIKDAMSMDEKPPPPTFETPSYDVPTTLDTAALHSINMANGPDRNTQQQQDDSVVGLTPPVPTMNQPVVERSTKRPSIATERPTFRPSFPTRRTFPTRKRPPPPYKFEIPLSTVATKPKKPSYQENIRPPMASIPSDELAPPMKPVTYHHPGKQEYNHSIKLNIGSQQPVSSVSINPVLGGSLKVEEVPQKPEVITADVKVRIHPNKSVILMQNKNHYGNQGNDNAHDASSYHSSSSTIKPPEMFSFNYVENVKDRNVVGNNEPTRRRPAVENSSSFNRDNERPPQQKPSVDGDQPSNVGFGIRVQGVELSNDQDNQASDKYYFSEANSSKKRKPDLDRNTYEVEKVSPPPTPQLYTPTPTPTSPFKAQNSEHMIIGSETIYPQDDIVTIATLPIDNKSMVQFHQVSTANAIQVTAGPSKPLQNYVTPVRNIEQGHSVVPLQLKNVNPPSGSSNIGSGKNGNILVQRPPPRMTTYVVTHTQTHTQTLTVTTTESRIVQSKGQKPSTHTLVVTQTHTSTILDTVTEVRTLIQPTSIVQTVTTTIPQATTTIFPTPVIHATKPTATIENQAPTKITVPDDSDTILVVMTDKNSKNTMPHKELDPNEPVLEIEGAPDDNEVSPNVLLGGLLSQHHLTGNECKPGCKASRNERCQKIDGIMRCVCRPGFARMFAERPCKPTYTFSMQVPLDRVGKEKITYTPHLSDSATAPYRALAEATKEGLDRMVMQSDLRDVYHGLSVTGFDKSAGKNDTVAKFYVKLSENTDQSKLEEVFKKHLQTNNFSMGGTELYASKEKLDFLRAEDFDECQDTKFNDCSEHAQCFNLNGTYTCSCKEGFTDLSHNTLYPGRICSADMIGCERCNFHGNCFPRESEDDLCECFQWYAGQYCQINLKVLLLILSLVGISLIVLLIVCLIMSCMRRKPLGRRGGRVAMAAAQFRPPVFRIRPHSAVQAQDKRAMIVDTSSEASMEHTPPPYVKQVPTLQSQMSARPQKPCRKQGKAPSPPLSYHGTMEQRDRSLTVMIPRAKYRPVPVQGSNLTMSTFGPEQKLLKYLTVEKPQTSRTNSRKPSNSTTNSQQSPEAAAPKKLSHAQAPMRKPSTGALVSAGFEVSATVGRTKEIQECFISEPHTDLNQGGGFSTIRTADRTVSEARSYDETLIHPPTKCLRGNYDRHDASEGHTMGERDTGSTFVMPQSQLYKPDRCTGSDISNFDSL
ncbi:calcium ion Hypothetical protein [Nesidiocoris tenuis]|uniref:Uncharacterized protein n=1 Tax=Nesidiocoris tenuis TaxID=355587 RepID=A0ABN7AUD2_9HEMI|nr:calcium ion Hypothetical protein [Nesidiocoris tenuis]